MSSGHQGVCVNGPVDFFAHTGLHGWLELLRLTEIADTKSCITLNLFQVLVASFSIQCMQHGQLQNKRTPWVLQNNRFPGFGNVFHVFGFGKKN